MHGKDALIIGGGHNGLVCACYLARAGFKVRVLEQRSVVGGAAVTEEFHPGFRNSIASYTVSLLHPQVIRDLHLLEHGLQIVARPLSNFLPLPNQQYLQLGGGLQATQEQFAKFSAHDARQLPAYEAMLASVGEMLRNLLLSTPPNSGGGLTDLLQAIRVGARARKLPASARADALDLFTLSVAELLERWFESDEVKAAFGFDAVVGTFASPYTPGTAYVLLHHVVGEVNGQRGAWGHAIGGMGAITQAMAREAQSLGVEITTSASVARIEVENGRAVGVVLDSGEVIRAPLLAANVNPKTLYLDLLPAAALDEDFRQRMQRYLCASATFRMNVALSELPDFSCLPGRDLQPHHQSGIVIAPSLDYLDRAHTDARRLGWSREPFVELLIPSTVDDTLAPPGQHVASLFCQHFNPKLPDGRSWDTVREAVADQIIETVNRHAPNFKASVLGRMILSPLDLERKLGLVGGDIFHGALRLNQLFSARPLLGHADYRAPIRGLYLCGSGAHPGGGVSGIPGHNAAREIIRDWRWHSA